MLTASALGFAILAALMFTLWLAHLRLRNAAIVDVGWAAGLGALALLYSALGSAPLPNRLLLAVLAGTWSFRLAWHLYRDRVADGTPEEGRYVHLRSLWGKHANHYFLYFFQGQGFLNSVLALPFLLTAFNAASGPGPAEYAAAVLWLAGITGESWADAQLKAFKSDPAHKGQVCRRGLWGYSRHPNYFCEWVVWCAYALLASPAHSAGGAWLGPIAWISPAIILFLLLKVSGIPPTEAQALRSRGEAYRRYQRSVSAFFPWFPKPDGD